MPLHRSTASSSCALLSAHPVRHDEAPLQPGQVRADGSAQQDRDAGPGEGASPEGLESGKPQRRGHPGDDGLVRLVVGDLPQEVLLRAR